MFFAPKIKKKSTLTNKASNYFNISLLDLDLQDLFLTFRQRQVVLVNQFDNLMRVNDLVLLKKKNLDKQILDNIKKDKTVVSFNLAWPLLNRPVSGQFQEILQTIKIPFKSLDKYLITGNGQSNKVIQQIIAPSTLELFYNKIKKTN